MERPCPNIDVSKRASASAFSFSLFFCTKSHRLTLPNFFFAFDQHLYVDRQFSVQFVQRLQRLEVNVNLPFVVRGAAPKQVPFRDAGSETAGVVHNYVSRINGFRYALGASRIGSGLGGLCLHGFAFEL